MAMLNNQRVIGFDPSPSDFPSYPDFRHVEALPEKRHSGGRQMAVLLLTTGSVGDPQNT